MMSPPCAAFAGNSQFHPTSTQRRWDDLNVQHKTPSEPCFPPTKSANTGTRDRTSARTHHSNFMLTQSLPARAFRTAPYMLRHTPRAMHPDLCRTLLIGRGFQSPSLHRNRHGGIVGTSTARSISIVQVQAQDSAFKSCHLIIKGLRDDAISTLAL